MYIVDATLHLNGIEKRILIKNNRKDR